MTNKRLGSMNSALACDDLGKLLLRLTVGGLMMFHGIHKLLMGIDGIVGMVTSHGLPGFVAYGVFVGEIIAPVLIILGILTRPAALILALTMVVAWLLAATGDTFHLDAVGGWAIESIVYYCVGALAIVFLGAGRYSMMNDSVRR